MNARKSQEEPKSKKNTDTNETLAQSDNEKENNYPWYAPKVGKVSDDPRRQPWSGAGKPNKNSSVGNETANAT